MRFISQSIESETDWASICSLLTCPLSCQWGTMVKCVYQWRYNAGSDTRLIVYYCPDITSLQPASSHFLHSHFITRGSHFPECQDGYGQGTAKPYHCCTLFYWNSLWTRDISVVTGLIRTDIFSSKWEGGKPTHYTLYDLKILDPVLSME